MPGSQPRPIAVAYLNEADIQGHRDNAALAKSTSIAGRQKNSILAKSESDNDYNPPIKFGNC